MPEREKWIAPLFPENRDLPAAEAVRLRTLNGIEQALCPRCKQWVGSYRLALHAAQLVGASAPGFRCDGCRTKDYVEDNGVSKRDFMESLGAPQRILDVLAQEEPDPNINVY